ncbi:MAG TPA: LamG-like jellyroll fold domain-containing protein [Microbacterium sp.]|nr:LamG-like jellyroll fold domain-containing protein [Microbacterium sp.]
MSNRREVKPPKLALVLTTLVGVLLATLTPAASYAAPPAATGTTYYVDSAKGSDAANGLSASKAWKTLDKVNAGPGGSGSSYQPGDRILFKSGGSWAGTLNPQGSGAAGSPIVIDRYGPGAKPLIHRDGGYANVNGIDFSAGVVLYNQQHWEINNLEVTNFTGSWSDGGWRQGILVFGKDAGTLSHIHISDTYVHDVNATQSTRADGGGYNKGVGGIMFNIEGTSVRTKFDDVKLEGNVIEDTAWGIGTTTSWMSGTISYSTNIVIRDNFVGTQKNEKSNTGRDGIIVRAADGALIEHNTLYKNGWAGVYPYRSKNTLIQYNEAGYNAYGLDDDQSNTNTILQYNYTHHNFDGFAIAMSKGIWRYNISENDAHTGGGHEGFIDFVPEARGSHFYNNVFYMGPETDDYLGLDPSGGPITFTNNIFYILGDFRFERAEDNVFDYNTYYGDAESVVPTDPHRSTADPEFVNPGNGNPNGYQLKGISPAIDAGATITGNAPIDYAGNPVPYNGGATDRGAFEYQGVGKLGDITAPGVAVTANGQTLGAELTIPEADTVTFDWTATDWGSGVASTSAEFNGQAYTQGTAISLVGLAGDHELVVTATDNAGNVLTSTHLIHVTPSMIDESQNHLTGTLVGELVPGVDGTAVKGYVTLPDAPALNIGGTKLTVEAWVKPDAAQTAPIVTKGNHQYSLKVDGSNLQFFIFSGAWRSVNAPLPANWVGEWHHVAGVYDGQTIQLYVDGQIVATAPYTGNIATSSYTVNVGRDSERKQVGNGAIDQVRIYNRALTVAELNDTTRLPDGNTQLWMDFE